MTKGLEALESLKHLQIGNPKGCHILWDIAEEKIDIIEKELKALEIIKNKRVDINLLLNSVDSEMYNMVFEDWTRPKRFQLTQQEYELLKEELE